MVHRTHVCRIAALVTVVAAALSTSCACQDEASETGPTHELDDLRWGSVTELDLLLVIDNSRSMADKQALFAEAVPALLKQLAEPHLTPDGFPASRALENIHIGVISSSLGSHGGDQCSPASPTFKTAENDHARLMPSVRTGLSSYQSLGFLWWDPRGSAGGASDLGALAKSFADHVRAAGENGCGYEATLEAWYRFLVDPTPPLDVVVEGGVAKTTGVDSLVLQQRADFLRPGSMLAIVMLTDENDCSIVDGGAGWLAASTANPDQTAFNLPRGTAVCATEPDSPCCRSCTAAEPSPPPGCQDLGSDSECQKGPWDDQGDHPNLRCWQQKQRFGADFLYPTRKYVEALTQPEICPAWDAAGPVACDARVGNPLFVSNRHPSLIILAGVVGVPWQDIATQASIDHPAVLEYRLPHQLDWDWLIPACQQLVSDTPVAHAGETPPRPVPICHRWDALDEPDDPLMIESPEPRSGNNPATLQPTVPESGGPGENSVNGHEWLTANGDLQYACIFPLAQPRDCASSAFSSCDCDDVHTGYAANNPVCQAPSGEYTQIQRFAKAFPGTRHLQVLHDLGEQAVVASICPKLVGGDSSAPAYGYNAALQSVVERLLFSEGPPFESVCLDPRVVLRPDGSAPCAVYDVKLDAPSCDCAGPGLSPISASLRKFAEARLEHTGACNLGASSKCSDACICELAQLSGEARSACQTEAAPDPKLFGFCPIITSQGVGTPGFDAWCGAGNGLLRFVGMPSEVHLLYECQY